MGTSKKGVRRRTSGGSVKRAISLPKGLDEKLHGLASREGQTYSGVIREAVEVYLGALEDRAVRAAYAKHYSSEENVRKDLGVAQDFSSLSRDQWP